MRFKTEKGTSKLTFLINYYLMIDDPVCSHDRHFSSCPFQNKYSSFSWTEDETQAANKEVRRLIQTYPLFIHDAICSKDQPLQIHSKHTRRTQTDTLYICTTIQSSNSSCMKNDSITENNNLTSNDYKWKFLNNTIEVVFKRRADKCIMDFDEAV